MSEFLGLTAVVTGGSSGIGQHVTRALLERGASVAILDVQAPTDEHDRLIYLRADLADTTSVNAAITECAERHGSIDIIVNNAGIGASGDVTSNPEDEWTRVLDINVTSIHRVVSAALPFLLNSSSPSIVNVSSVVANVGVPNRALYSASKGAVQSLSLAMAADFVQSQVRVNAVCPGTADTPWIERLLAASDDPVRERAALEGRQPIGRLVKPEEVAHAVCYLASPLSGSTTGTVVVVDGGMQSLRLPK